MEAIYEALYENNDAEYLFDIVDGEACINKIAFKRGILKSVKIPDEVQHNGMIYPVTRISGRKVKTSPKDAIYVTDRRRKDYGSLISFSGEYNYREVNLFYDGSTLMPCYGEVETVILPKYLREIGDYTFKECVSLKHVKINSSLEVIGKSAFEGCKALKELTLPSSVKKIGNFCFSQSSVALKIQNKPGTVEFDMYALDSDDSVKYIGKSLFAKLFH